MTMRRWAALAGVVAALATGAATQQALAAEAPSLSRLESARFPERSFVLTLPAERRLATGDVRLLENGKRVASPSLVPADILGARGLGLVVVIDASVSMRGRPIAAAMRAARAFAGRRRAEQRLGVVMFNERATTLAPLSADQATIDAALASEPRLGRGTAIRDAALAGVEMLRDERMVGGSVVLLSDGADTYSTARMDAVVAAARRAGARVFTVGLQSRSYEPSQLEELADRTSGGYAVASSPRQLERVFDRLGSVLSNEYVLRYRSLAGPAERVGVELHIEGEPAAAHATYTSPALDLQPATPFRRSLADAFWRSPAAAAAVSLACALLLFAVVLLLLRNRGGGLLDRVRQFAPVSPHGGDPDARSPATRFRPAKRSRLSLSGVAWWERFKEDMDVARMEVRPERLVLAVLAGTVLAMWLLAALVGTPVASLLALAIPATTRSVVRFKAGRQRRAFAEQLADNIQVVASAMRAGHSFAGALSVVVEEAAEPSRREFGFLIQDERLGKPIEAAFTAAAARMRNEELDHIGLVARLQTQTGGNTAEVLDRLVDTLRSRAELRRLVRTLTAQGRLGGWVVSALPVVILIALTLLSREYAEKIFKTSAGHGMLIASATLILLGSLVIRRIVDIKVV
jgi:tight adherence protein B